MLNNIISRIKNMIKIGFISLNNNDDSTDRHIMSVSYMDKQLRCYGVYPYGLSANAPANTTQAICFNVFGSDSNVAAIPVNQEMRFKNLKTGEVQIGNFINKSNIHFQETSDITITSNGKLTANVKDNVEIISTGNEIKLQVGSATLTLTDSLLVSSVPIQAPSYAGSSGGAANMTSGINMAGQSITDVGALNTSGGVNLSTHIHTGDSGGDTGAPKN